MTDITDMHMAGALVFALALFLWAAVTWVRGAR